MKKLLLLSILLQLCLLSEAQMPGKWRWKNTSSTSTHFFNLEYVGNNTWYAAGSAGTVVKSTDDGLTWTLLSVSTSLESNYLIEHSSFVDAQYGYISNGGSVFKTSNGGSTWSDVSNAFNGGSNIRFADANVGWKGLGELSKTTDGGATWNLVNLPNFESDDRTVYHQIHSVTKGVLFQNVGKLYKTVDGTIWTKVANPTRMWGDELVSSFDESRITMCRNAWTDTVFTTSNGGTTWKYGLVSYNEKGTRTCISYANGSTILLGLYNYNSQKDRVKIARSGDGGLTWNYASLPDFVGVIKKIEMKDANVGIAIASNGCLIKTTDGGITWVQLNMVGNMTAEDVKFENENNGLIVGHNAILYTRDGGKNFKMASISPTDPGVGTSEFNGVVWLSSSKALAMGYGGYAYFSNDTGASFTQGNYTWFIGTFYDVAFNKGNGKIFAVGRAADGMKNYTVSANGGNSWTAAQMPGSFDIQRIYFYNDLIGFATGADSVHYASSGINKAAAWKTVDGGNTWQKLVLPGLPTGYSDAKDVFMVDANTGWMVGTKIWKTTNGGNTWVEVSAGIALGKMLGVYFEDSQKGHIVGLNGYYIYTTDAGATWTKGNLHQFGTLKRFTKIGNVLALCAEGGGLLTQDGTPSTMVKEEIINLEEIVVYPNPTQERNIFIKLPLELENVLVEAKIYDLQGKLLFNKESINERVVQMPLEGFGSGIYFMRIEGNGTTQLKKFLIE